MYLQILAQLTHFLPNEPFSSSVRLMFGDHTELSLFRLFTLRNPLKKFGCDNMFLSVSPVNSTIFLGTEWFFFRTGGFLFPILKELLEQ